MIHVKYIACKSNLTIKLYTHFRAIGLIIFLVYSASTYGQNSNTSESRGNLTYQEYFQRLEKIYQLQVFYKPEWFSEKQVSSALLEMKLPDALARIDKLAGVEHILIDSTNLIFIPLTDSLANGNSGGGDDIMIIGNSLEYGKYKRAKLKGHVFNGTTGEPLAGVSLQLEHNSQYAVTDIYGEYSLEIPVGEYTLIFNYIGYESRRQKIRLTSNGTADFDLFEKTLELGEVVITDSRADNRINRSSLGNIRMDSKTLKALPTSLGESDLMKAVTLLPGIQSVGEFGSGFIVRGSNADQNLVLLDEQPVFNTSHLFGLQSTLNTDAIQSVTLYKAGIPAQYGERTSSVLSIKTGNDQQIPLRVRGGLGPLNGRISLDGRIFRKRVYILLAARSSYSNWLLHQLPDLDLKNSSAGFNDINLQSMIPIGKNDKLNLSGYMSNDNFSFNRNTHYFYGNRILSLRWNHVFNKRLTSSMTGGWSNYLNHISQYDSLYRQDGKTIDFRIDYYSLKAAVNWFPNAHHAIETGFNLMEYRNQAGTLKPYNNLSAVIARKLAREQAMEAAFYCRDDWNPTGNLNLDFGVRLVRYLSRGPGLQYTYAEGLAREEETIIDTIIYQDKAIMTGHFALEPRIAIRYSLTENSSIKAGYSRIHQYLSLISNTAVMSPTDTWKLSNPYFDPIYNDQYSLGYYCSSSDNSYESSLEAWFKQSHNEMDYKNGAELFMNPHLETEMMKVSGYGYGLEFYLKKNKGNISGWISYTYSRSFRHTNSGILKEQINSNKDYPSTYDIPHNLVTSVNYQITRRWKASATFYYNTGRPVTLPELKYLVDGNQLTYFSSRNKYRMPDYHRLDVSVTLDQNLRVKRQWKGSWTLSIINVYGRKNAYSIFYAREDPRNWDFNNRYSLYKLYIMGIPFPTLTYNFVF